MRRRNIAGNLKRLSAPESDARTLQTDDRQKGRTTANSEREHEFTFAKNPH